MDFIQTSNKQVDKFGAGKHGFSAGNPAGGVAATFMSPEFCDDLMMELINVIEGAGLAAAAATRTQVKQGVDIMIRKSAGAVCAAGGTADAITGAFTPVVAALVDGMLVRVRAANANATTTPTFKADGTALKTIVKGNNLPLVAGDIAGAGHWLQLQYDLTQDKWVLLNPAMGVNALGVGQTWTTVTGTRSLGTTFTNTTGRPIQIVVAVLNTVAASSSAVGITVAGIVTGSLTVVATGGIGSQSLCVTAIVPPGATYSASGTQCSLSTWNELR